MPSGARVETLVNHHLSLRFKMNDTIANAARGGSRTNVLRGGMQNVCLRERLINAHLVRRPTREQKAIRAVPKAIRAVARHLFP